MYSFHSPEYFDWGVKFAELGKTIQVASLGTNLPPMYKCSAQDCLMIQRNALLYFKIGGALKKMLYLNIFHGLPCSPLWKQRVWLKSILRQNRVRCHGGIIIMSWFHSQAQTQTWHTNLGVSIWLDSSNWSRITNRQVKSRLPTHLVLSTNFEISSHVHMFVS